MCMTQDTEAGTIWLDEDAREALEQWRARVEDREGFTPNPGQAVESACTKAIAWDERGSDVL